MLRSCTESGIGGEKKEYMVYGSGDGKSKIPVKEKNQYNALKKKKKKKKKSITSYRRKWLENGWRLEDNWVRIIKKVRLGRKLRKNKCKQWRNVKDVDEEIKEDGFNIFRI